MNEVIELVAHARRRAEAAGRDPDALELTVMFRPDRDSAERWAEAGADRVVVVLPTTEDVERHGAEVIAKLGGSGARAGTT